MREACSLIWTALVRLFRTRASLVAEILVLRHQINIQRRHLPKRQTFRIMDRLIFAGLYRLAPNVLNALAILKPETVLKWHRAGFRSYWRWKSRRHAGRPIVPLAVRKLIREMSIAIARDGIGHNVFELAKLVAAEGQTGIAVFPFGEDFDVAAQMRSGRNDWPPSYANVGRRGGVIDKAHRLCGALSGPHP